MHRRGYYGRRHYGRRHFHGRPFYGGYYPAVYPYWGGWGYRPWGIGYPYYNPVLWR